MAMFWAVATKYYKGVVRLIFFFENVQTSMIRNIALRFKLHDSLDPDSLL